MPYFSETPYRSRLRHSIFVVASLLLLFAAASALAFPMQQDMSNMPGMSDSGKQEGNRDEEMKVSASKLASDKRESEFNHHFAGLLLAIAGLLMLMHASFLTSRAIRYAWPLCLFAAGLFVLVFSDTEIWPFGPQSPWFAITHNLEDLQHKLFAIILLLIGFIEFQRVRGKLREAWSAFVFPLAGLAGVVMLLFHSHSAGMHGQNHMQLMKHIQFQHRWYSAVGLGVVAAKGATDLPVRGQRVFAKLWPLLLAVLGVSLMLYTE